jgi:hypothetical protein
VLAHDVDSVMKMTSTKEYLGIDRMLPGTEIEPPVNIQTFSLIK